MVDSSAILALVNRNDPDHLSISKSLDKIERKNSTVFMTNFLRSEAYTLLGARLGWDVARNWLEAFDLPMIWVTRNDENDAIELLLTYDDKSFSYVDATSFVIMERLGVEKALTLDEDFGRYGFSIVGWET